MVEEMGKSLPLLQDADLTDKIVLIRFDHNVVKKGTIKDSFRIERSLGTLYHIVARGGRPVLMTHVGRPRDKKTGRIACRQEESVKPIAEYLQRRLCTEFKVPECEIDPEYGITTVDASIISLVEDLRNRKISGIYLPNTRWFRGEEGEGFFRDNLAVQLSDLADIYVNDAFGSWQPHVSTYDITKFVPSYAGFLMQQEISALNSVVNPEKPFLAVIAGSKYDTKIGPLTALYDTADFLILGGVLYNAYLCAKYDVSIEGISEEDVRAARELVEKDSRDGKILEMSYVVESDTTEGKIEGKHRTVSIRDMSAGKSYGYILDVDPSSFDEDRVKDAIMGSRSIFVNAVMGLTPHFPDGSKALYTSLSQNRVAKKVFGGGDTLQEFKTLCPGLYMSVVDDPGYYFFTGGGTVLKAIEQGSPFGLQPVQALIDNKQRQGTG